MKSDRLIEIRLIHLRLKKGLEKEQKTRVTKGASNDLYPYKSLVGELPNPPVHFLCEKMIVLDKSAAARFFKTLILEKSVNSIFDSPAISGEDTFSFLSFKLISLFHFFVLSLFRPIEKMFQI